MKRVLNMVAVTCIGLVLTLTVLIPALRAQDWQPISKEDLALKDNPASPGAHAMILYRESNVDTNEATISEYVRIKIFTEEGKKWANVGIPFAKGHNDIHDVRARTIRPDGSIVNFDGKVYEKEVYKGNELKVLEKSFSLPEVQPGCIIEYKYHEQHNRDYLVEPVWVLQKDLFTRFAKFTFHPYRRDIDYQLYWRYNTPAKTEPKRQSDGSYVMEVHDLSGIDEEQYMFPRKVLEARLEFFYREPGDPQNEPVDHYWKRIGKKWNDDFEHFINRRNALEAEVGQIISANDSAETKLHKIYTRAQKVRDTDYDTEKTQKEQKAENLKQNDNVEDVLKRSYGTSRQINFLFIGLARAAGFDATAVYVAPRNSALFTPEMEDPSQLDDDLVWAKLGNAEVYLDPAAQYYPYGLLPWYETGVKGLRLNKQGGELITTTAPNYNDARRERHAELSLDADGNLSGKLIVDYFGQLASSHRQAEREDDDAGKKKDMKDMVQAWLLPGASFEVSQTSGWDDNSSPLRIEGTLHMTGFGATTGRRVLAPVTVFRSSEAQAFEASKRVNAIYFHYPYIEHDDISVHIPDGYSIETVPEAQKTPEEAVMVYSLAATSQGANIHIDRRLDVKSIFFEAKYYPAVRSFFNQVKNNDESQFVLTSSQSAGKK